MYIYKVNKNYYNDVLGLVLLDVCPMVQISRKRSLKIVIT